MTETSLFPDAARAAGIEFPDLVERLVVLAGEIRGEVGRS
jgi:D-alanine-D-alanine ligase